MTTPRASRSLPALAALLLSLPLAGGCGDVRAADDGRGADLVRLELRPIGELPDPTPETYIHEAFEGPECPPHWSFDGGDWEVQFEKGNRRAEPWYGLRPTSGEGGSFGIDGSFDPKRFNQVAISIAIGGKTDLAVSLYRDGELALKTPFVRYAGSNEPQTILANVAGTIAHEAPFDRLAIRYQRVARRPTLLGVDLLRTPIPYLMPDTSAGMAPVSHGGETRTAVTLCAAAPLEGRAVVPRGAVLRFAYARPFEVRHPRERPRLAVKVSGESGVIAETVFPLARGRDSRDWTETSLPLPPGAGGQVVTVRFQLVDTRDDLTTCVLASPRLERPSLSPPTVVLVTSDTHRADHLGIAGVVDVETPFLDGLAERGIYFADCYSTTNITNPAHGSLLTALHVRDTGVVDNITALSRDARTLAEVFQEAGWWTVCVTSAEHLQDSQSGLGQGFDRMLTPRLASRDSIETIAQLEGCLAESTDVPLFVWLHVFDIHAPYEPPEDYRWMYYDREKDPRDESLPVLPPEARAMWDPAVRDVEFWRSQYKSEVSYLDAQLARILSHPRLAEAIVAVTADHGESLGDHGLYYTHKGLYPNTLAVPLILRWPEGPAGVRVEQSVASLDVGRTLLDLAGLSRRDFPGMNLLRFVEAEQEVRPRYGICSHGQSASIELDGWYLVLNFSDHRAPVRVKHQVELYDLRSDPRCFEDLVDREPERTRELRERLVDWLAEAPAVKLALASGTPDRDSLAQLAELGYATDVDSPASIEVWYEPDPESDWCRRFEE